MNREELERGVCDMLNWHYKSKVRIYLSNKMTISLRNKLKRRFGLYSRHDLLHQVVFRIRDQTTGDLNE